MIPFSRRGPIVLLTMGLLASATALGAQTTFMPPDTSGWTPVQHELMEFERARSSAIARHDTTALARIYADDFRGVTAVGYEVTKGALLQVFTRDDPTTVFTIDEIVITPLGRASDAAVLTARLTTLRRTGEVVASSRFTHVYERREGRWQIVAAQGTLVRRPD
jgi:hypothetical protein